jgi:hypothetical protein
MREMIEQLENEKVVQNDGGIATVLPGDDLTIDERVK